MDYVRLGGSGLRISEIAYGNWLTHGAQIDQDTARSCIQAALDEGVTTFDTADVYAMTKAEQELGDALFGLRRESVEISTKVFWPTGPGANDRGLSRKHIMESAHASLRRLRTDYIDLYQAHRFDPDTPLEETLQAFDDLVRQGKALYIGVSEWRAEQIERALEIANAMGLHRIISNQPQYNIIWRVVETEILPLCMREGIGQIVWSPIAQGVLSGKYRLGLPVPAGSRASHAEGSGYISNLLADEILTRVERLRSLAKEVGLSPAQFAIAWTLQHPGVAAAVVGASRPDQIRENARASGVRLPEDMLREIDKIFEGQIITDPCLTPASSTRSTVASAGPDGHRQ
ncbi:aldo/keto reductase family protein [Kitasatospora sp. NPDC058048]|uniref:aldo/keto reductase family protein n=1 Tax=Kitasatospora sp. NPDC058048 TaxID=3346313 RepID=UPI0036DDE18B